MATNEQKVYLVRVGQGEYRITRVINTLAVNPGDTLTEEQVRSLMQSKVIVIIDPKGR